MDLLMLADVGTGLLGLGVGLAALGGGVAAIGAGIGIGRAGGDATTAIARQPDRSNEITRNMMVTAVLIEGVAIFGAVISFLAYSGLLQVLQTG